MIKSTATLVVITLSWEPFSLVVRTYLDSKNVISAGKKPIYKTTLHLQNNLYLIILVLISYGKNENWK